MIYSLLQSSACLFLTAVGFLCTHLSVFFSCSFNLPDWTPFLMRNIYCSPIPSVCDLFAPHFLKLFSLQLLFPPFIFDRVLFFVILSFASFSFSPPLQQPSFSLFSHLPEPHSQSLLYLPPVPHLAVLSPLLVCLTDVLPFLCHVGFSSGSISPCGRKKHFLST